MPREKTYVTLDGVDIVTTTKDAVLVNFGDDEYWIPRSVIEDDSECEDGAEDVDLEVEEWFASRNEIV